MDDQAGYLSPFLKRDKWIQECLELKFCWKTKWCHYNWMISRVFVWSSAPPVLVLTVIWLWAKTNLYLPYWNLLLLEPLMSQMETNKLLPSKGTNKPTFYIGHSNENTNSVLPENAYPQPLSFSWRLFHFLLYINGGTVHNYCRTH